MPEQCWEVVGVPVGSSGMIWGSFTRTGYCRLLQWQCASREVSLQRTHFLCPALRVSRSKAAPPGLIPRESSYLPPPLCSTSLGVWIHSCSSINIKPISLSRERKLKWQGLWQMLWNVDLFITESQASFWKLSFLPSPHFFNVQTSKQWVVASVTATKPCQLKPVEHSLQW